MSKTALRRLRDLVAGSDPAALLHTPWGTLNEAVKAIDGAAHSDEAMRLLLAPTGPLQDLSVDAGWSEEFLALAAAFDES